MDGFLANYDRNLLTKFLNEVGEMKKDNEELKREVKKLREEMQSMKPMKV